VIETARLRLRPFVPADAAAHRRLYADPEVTRWLGGGPFVGEEAERRSARALRRFVEQWEQRGFGVWAVLDRATGAFLGQCGLSALDALREIELLYAFHRAAWGRGLATEAARAALAYAFDAAGLARVIAVASPDNLASRRVLEKIGMVYEKDVEVFGIVAVCYAITRAGGGDRT
jgi:ribosomal-protein-alanine N-acetyltransferase